MTGPNAQDSLQKIKQRRDGALKALVMSIPYAQYLDIVFDRRGDELTGILPFREDLIGNPILPALHGGATAAFLEISSVIQLSWSLLWEDLESGAIDLSQVEAGNLPRMPKSVSFAVDYLRSGLPRDSYSRAYVNRSGRRYASVRVETWQDNRMRPIAQATGHFVMPVNG